MPRFSLASTLLASALAISTVRATSETPNAVYLDPIRLATPLMESDIFPYVALTYERELGRGMSLTARPVYYAANLSSTDDLRRTEQSVWMTSFDVSFRKYLFEEASEGLYFAPSIGYLHISVEDTYIRTSHSYVGFPAEASYAIDAIPFVYHVGWRQKWGRFTGYADLGLGKLFLAQDDYLEIWVLLHPEHLGLPKSAFIYDANLGIGVAF